MTPAGRQGADLATHHDAAVRARELVVADRLGVTVSELAIGVAPPAADFARERQGARML